MTERVLPNANVVEFRFLRKIRSLQQQCDQNVPKFLPQIVLLAPPRGKSTIGRPTTRCLDCIPDVACLFFGVEISSLLEVSENREVFQNMTALLTHRLSQEVMQV